MTAAARLDGGAAPPLRLERLSKQFPGRLAVDDLSLTVEAGEVYFLHLIGELWSVPRARRDARIAELAPLFRLGELLDGHVEHYSRGNRQKLALVAALLHDPRRLVIDEPIVGLDPESAVRTRELLRAFVAAGGAVLLCTPTLAFAESVCRRVGMLRDGRMVVEGAIRELRDRLPGAASLEELYLHFAAAR